MILKMVEIHQVDYIDDISKGFVDGGDRSIQSLLRHIVNSKDQRWEFTCIKKVFLFVNRPLADLLTFPRSDENVKAKDNIVSE